MSNIKTEQNQESMTKFNVKNSKIEQNRENMKKTMSKMIKMAKTNKIRKT